MMMNHTTQPREQDRTPQTAPAVRIPAAIKLKVSFHDEQGIAMDPDVCTGVSRDVSATGVGFDIPSLSGPLATKLKESSPGIKVFIDIELPERTIRVRGKTLWLRVLANGNQERCVAGIEYEDLDPKLATTILTHANKLLGKPRFVKPLIAVVASLLLASSFLIWRVSNNNQAETLALEKELEDALLTKQQLADQLDKVRTDLDSINNNTNPDTNSLAEKKKALADLQKEFEATRNRVGALSVSLSNVRLPPPDDPEAKALFHMDRAYEFSRQENLAAAMIEFQQALEMRPNLPQAYLEMGTINELYGRNREAIRCYEKYIELKPDAIDAFDIKENIRNIRTFQEEFPDSTMQETNNP